MFTQLFFSALVVASSATVAALPWWAAFFAWGAVLFVGANFWFRDRIPGSFGDKIQEITVGPSIGGRLTSAMNWIGTAVMHAVVFVVVTALANVHAGWNIYVLWYVKMYLLGMIELAGYFVWVRQVSR